MGWGEGRVNLSPVYKLGIWIKIVSFSIRSPLNSMNTMEISESKKRFYEQMNSEDKRYNCVDLSTDVYNDIIDRLEELESDQHLKKSFRDFRLLKRYSLKKNYFNGQEIKTLCHKISGKPFVRIEDIFNVLHEKHISATGHGGMEILHKEVSVTYANITQKQVKYFVESCSKCYLKKSKARKGIVVKPIVSNDFNSRCQIDLIDMQSQPDGEYKFILDYQDHLTKFCFLKPLKKKTKEEVAIEVLDIFCTIGAPGILHSDNGREFVNTLIEEIKNMWPDCKLVRGKPRHSQSQGSVERCNQDVESILACWMKENNTSHWSQGLRFVQFQKNNRFHRGIKQIFAKYLLKI